MIVTPRWYQEEAINSIIDYFAIKAGNPVVAMPTGTGKTIVIAEFIRRVMQWWPNQRFLVATHVKELIEQNANKMLEVWAHAPIGINSASIGARDYAQPIIYAGIQSIYKLAHLLGHRDILFIDECHLLNPKDGTMYMALIEALRQINPLLKVVGLSATIYRMGQGYITDGSLFTDVCCDFTSMDRFNLLLDQGWLAPLIPKRTDTSIDLTEVHVTNGEYNQTELETATEKITYDAIQEALRYSNNRHSWLVFCAGVKHAVKTRNILNSYGISAVTVHSKTKDYNMTGDERDANITMFKAGQVRAITNNNVLTTGFDHPPVDMILMLRATLSTSLWVQMLGRGTRPFKGDSFFPIKHNCLVLDYAGNTARLGPINDPVIPKRKGKGGGDAPVKICDHCGSYNHISARVCIGCGAPFIIESKIEREASEAELIRSSAPAEPPAPPPDPVFETFTVERVYYYRRSSAKKPLPWFEACYHCAGILKPFKENVFFEHDGKAKHRAKEWWRARSSGEPPATIAEALDRVAELRVPYRIRVQTNREWPEIVGYEYDNRA